MVEQLILKEKPDSVLPTLGGQAGLNLAMELEDAGFLKEHDVRLIGTTALTIKKAEDREMFKETMEKIGEPVAPSDIVEDVKHGLEIAAQIGYPVVLRPAYTLGGSGGGIAHNPEQCAESWKTASGFHGWGRSWWSAASRAGRKSSTRSCATAPAM